MVLKPLCFTILFTASLPNAAWANKSCLNSVPVEVSSLALAIKTIYPNVSQRSLHYLYKDFDYDNKTCNIDEVWVQGPLFSEGGFSSEGEVIVTSGTKAEKLKNSFCMSKTLFESERQLGESVFQTRVSSGSKNQGTSFLVGDNIIMTNYHIAFPGPNGKDCKALEVTLNKDKEEWIGCKKVLYCDKAYDVCFVEMNPTSPGVEIGDLVSKVKLNCSPVVDQSGLLIGNVYKYGIQASAGPIKAEVNGKIKHHLPMVGGASGSPLINDNGEVIGINYGHASQTGQLKGFVSMNEAKEYNLATSLYWVRSDISQKLKELQYNDTANLMLNNREDLLKVDKIFKQNSTCLD